MNCNITYTKLFEKSLKRLSKHYKSLRDDFANFLHSVQDNPLQGVDLGGGVRKVRMSIASKGKGKSGGARVLTFLISQEEDFIHIVLLDIYDKSERETMTDNEIKTLLKKSRMAVDYNSSGVFFMRVFTHKE